MVKGRLTRQSGSIGYHLAVTNTSVGFLDGFMFQTNKNSFGLTPSNQVWHDRGLACAAAAVTCVLLARSQT